MIQARYQKQYGKEFTIKYQDLEKLEIHESANNLSMLSELEYQTIFNDMETGKQQEPIVLIESKGGKKYVIDGRNRLRMLKELNRDVRAVIISGLDTDRDRREYVRHSVMDDRNYNPGQRAMTAAEEYRHSQDLIKSIDLMDISGNEKKKKKIAVKVSQKEVAEAWAVSKRTLESALKVHSQKDIAEKVLSGESTMNSALQAIKAREAIAPWDDGENAKERDTNAFDTYTVGFSTELKDEMNNVFKESKGTIGDFDTTKELAQKILSYKSAIQRKDQKIETLTKRIDKLEKLLADLLAQKSIHDNMFKEAGIK